MDLAALFETADPLVAAALVTGLAAFAASGLLVVSILLLRFVRRLHDAAARAVVERWRPLFAAALVGDAPAPRAARRAEAQRVVALLYEILFGIKGEGRGRLADFARSCGLEGWARRFALAGGVRDRLPAIAVLGQLAGGESRAALAALVADPNPVLSLAAARALLAVDPARVADEVLARALEREDWPDARVLAILQDNPHAALEHALLEAFDRVAPARLARLLAFARVVPADRLAPVLRRLLETETRPEVLARVLRLVADPHEAARVRALAGHAEWFVRLAAIQALGRIASRADLPFVTAALADAVWWVRQRAADALVRLPFLDRAQLERIAAGLSDRYARDALARAMAEHFGA